jgi:hypothetical protein
VRDFPPNSPDEVKLPLPKRGRFLPKISVSHASRKAIKGHDLEYYLASLKELREKSQTEFAKRDDEWLMTVDTRAPSC